MKHTSLCALKDACSYIENSPEEFFTPELQFFRRFVRKMALVESDNDTEDEAPPPCVEDTCDYKSILVRAETDLRKGRFRQAIKRCDTVLNDNPNSCRAHRCQAKAYCKLEEWQLALVSVQEAQSIDYNTEINQLETQIKMHMPATSSAGPTPSPDIASLLNNPNLMSMASELMRNPDMVANMQTMLTKLGNQNSNSTQCPIIEDAANIP